MKPIRAIQAAPCITGALLFGFGSIGTAFAQDFSLNGFISDTLDFTQNADLSPVSAGATLTSSTTFGLNLLSETPVSSFGLDIASSLYLAREPDGSTSAELGYPSLSLSYNNVTASKSITFGASYRVSPAGDGSTFLVDDEDDDGIIDPGEVTTFFTDALRTTLAVSGAYSVDMTESDTLRLSVRASRVDFDGFDPDLVPSARQSIRLNWSHRFADDLSGGASISNTWFSNEDVVPQSSETTALSGNLSYDVNNAMTIAGSLGIERVALDEGGTLTDTDSLTGGVSVDFALPDGSLGADFEFGVEPSDGGSLQRTASFDVSYSKNINAVSSVSVALGITEAADIGESFGSGERSFRFTPTYSHQITDDINGNVGFRYERVDDAASHGIFVGISKNFAFLK